MSPIDASYRFIAPPSPCGYLPDRWQSLEYHVDPGIRPEAYMDRMAAGWRRFGETLFKPRCGGCSACRSIRVDVDRFRPDRSQRRAARANRGEVMLQIGEPAVTRENLELYRRFHADRAETKGWPSQDDEGPGDYRSSFVANPFPTEEWRYRLDRELVGIGYVDTLPGGLSAIYFIHEPAHRNRSLGTWNVLAMIDRARELGLPHVYLGYFVADCPSLAYKARFAPNEILSPGGRWLPFRP